MLKDRTWNGGVLDRRMFEHGMFRMWNSGFEVGNVGMACGSLKCWIWVCLSV